MRTHYLMLYNLLFVLLILSSTAEPKEKVSWTLGPAVSGRDISVGKMTFEVGELTKAPFKRS